jgi:hypothetical protein
MMHNATHIVGSATRLAGYLIRDGKKTGVAVALVAIMAVMWLRVLVGQRPKGADARPASPQKVEQAADEGPSVRFVELPIRPGRNDRIHRNFFTANDWSRFSSGSRSQGTTPQTDVKTGQTHRTEEVIARLAKTLELEAVLWSDHPQAFVNDRLIRVGDTLALRDGADFYPFEVVQIQKDAVLVRCGDRQYTLKLSPPTDVRK